MKHTVRSESKCRKETRPAVNYLSSLADLLPPIAGAPTLNSALQFVIEAVCARLGWDFGECWQFLGTGDDLTRTGFWAVDGSTRRELADSPVTLSLADPTNPVVQAWAAREMVWVSRLPRTDRFAAWARKPKSAIAIPIQDTDSPTAILACYSKGKRPHDEQHEQVLRLVARQVEFVADRARSEEELRQRVQHASLAAEIGRALSHTSDIDHALDGCATSLVDHLGAVFARIWLLDPTDDTLVLRASAGLYRHLDGLHSRIPVGKWKIGAIASRKQPVLINDLQHDPEITDPAWAAQTGIRGFAGYPLLVDEGLIGVMAVFAYEPITHTVLQTLDSIAMELALGIRRKQADEQILLLNDDLEARVAARTSELEVALREIEAFTYSISHDLRTPLRAIDAYSRILQQDFENVLSSEATRYLSLVCSNVQRMGKLISDLLDFAHLGRQNADKVRVEPTRIARQALEDLTGEVQGRNVDVRLDNLPPCEADELLLKQVYLNLLSNAFKFTRTRERATIHIGCEQQDEQYVYFVKDNGVGFKMKYADKLFGVFQRLHQMDEYEGTGVGLAIVHRIIAKHNGAVWGEGEEGNGAAFYFTLGDPQ